jgi:hypothetical protein
MDWLVSHGVQIDCGENTVTLKNPIREKVVYQGDRNAHLKAELQLNALKENKIEDICSPHTKPLLWKQSGQRCRHAQQALVHVSSILRSGDGMGWGPRTLACSWVA